MYDYLVDHARKNVWCTPDQDLQYIVQPKRITPRFGMRNKADILYRTVWLPEQNKTFHVFHVGQIHPLLLGLFPSLEKWKNVAENCVEQKMLFDVYNTSGLRLNASDIWYQTQRDRNLVIAVRAPNRTAFNPGEEDLFVRLYTNAYFNSVRSHTQVQAIQVRGGLMSTNADILALQNEIMTLRQRQGAINCFVNGQLTANIDLVSAKPGDDVEFVYDSSIKKVVDLRIGDLTFFDSTLDENGKFLLHYPVDPQMPVMIDFDDDIDAFVWSPTTTDRFRGIYMHRNDKRTLRNVTHRDYAVMVPTVDAIVTTLRGMMPNAPRDDMRIRLNIRNSGWERPLVNEDHRIQELYKLPAALIPRAMNGLDATVEEWQAASLEASTYAYLMQSKWKTFTRTLVDKAYGYNAVAKLLGDTPQIPETVSGTRMITLPYGLRKESTGFEYDAEGKFLLHSAHVDAQLYPVRDSIRTQVVEVLSGYFDYLTNDVYGKNEVPVPEDVDFRCYTCPVVNGMPTNQWTDVTGTNRYLYQDGVVKWAIPANLYPMVRTDKSGLIYNVDVAPYAGNVRFAIRQQVYRNDILLTQNMQVPMRELSIIMNGASLVEGIDYIVKFPEVVIISQRHLRLPYDGPQNIWVRFSGLCDKDLKYRTSEDRGFVAYGRLSHNNRYDVRDDKVTRIVLGGSVKHRSQVKFGEVAGEIIVDDALNGQPYSISDVLVPLRSYSDLDTYEAKKASEVIDRKVSDYLTRFVPKPTYDSPNAIQQKYVLISPFINAVINDLRDGYLDDPRLNAHFSDDVIRQILTPYEPLLAFDPTQPANELDRDFVDIYPHPYEEVIPLHIRKYEFVRRALTLYQMDTWVSVSQFLSIKPL